MLKSCLALILIGSSACLHVSKIATEIMVVDADLPKAQSLQIPGVKKTSKAFVEHVILKNCSGSIDEATFKHFPKLSKITLAKSHIDEIGSTLQITHLTAMGSHLPNLDSDLQAKLPKLRALMLLGNKNFQVDPLVIKSFKHLQALHISEANFTEDCVTKGWFKGMTSLQELGLSDNGIHCIAEDAFQSLRSLRKLDLTYNRISNLEKTLFKKLTKLEQLGLYENDLETVDFPALTAQMGHLEVLGVSWSVLRTSGVSAEDVLRTLPKLESVSFGHSDMPEDFKAGEFCQNLKQNGASCGIDSVFGVSTILGYS